MLWTDLLAGQPRREPAAAGVLLISPAQPISAHHLPARAAHAAAGVSAVDDPTFFTAPAGPAALLRLCLRPADDAKRGSGLLVTASFRSSQGRACLLTLSLARHRRRLSGALRPPASRLHAALPPGRRARALARGLYRPGLWRVAQTLSYSHAPGPLPGRTTSVAEQYFADKGSHPSEKGKRSG